MNEKILIVDDDLESLKLIGLMLQRRGYQIVAAQGGAQAIAKAHSENPDMIILDVMMPDMDGFEVCRQLRSLPVTAHTPIVMFTAKTTVSDKVTGFQAGADDYLTKPIHPAELASRVEAVLLRSSRARPGTPEPVSQARIISFFGCKGGVGTSTLALNVAVTLYQESQAAQARRVLLAELLTGGATLGLQIGTSGQAGLADLLGRRIEEINAQAVEAQLTRHTTGVKLLLASHKPRSTSLPAPYAKAIVRQLASLGDILVLDLGAALDDGARAALQLSHSIVVVIEAQRVALAMTQMLVSDLEGMGIPRSNIGLVLVNRMPSASSLTRSAIEDMLKTPVLSIIPPAPELAFQAIESGKPLVLLQPNSLVSTQLRELTHRIVQQQP